MKMRKMSVWLMLAALSVALLLSGCFLALGNSGAKNPKKEKKAVDNPTDS